MGFRSWPSADAELALVCSGVLGFLERRLDGFMRVSGRVFHGLGI